MTFELKHAYAPFVEVVSTQYPIVPAHLLEHANPLSWGSKPHIDRVAVLEIPDVTTMALEVRTGQLDYMIAESSQFAQLRKDPRLESGILPIGDFVAFALNTTRAPLDDVRVRRAISTAIDRARIVRDVTFGTGTPAYADLPAFLWQSPEPRNPYGYDPAKARALLDAAGWHTGWGRTRSKNGQPLHLVAIDFSGKRQRSNDRRGSSVDARRGRSARGRQLRPRELELRLVSRVLSRRRLVVFVVNV